MPFLVAVVLVISVLQERERNHIQFLQMLIRNTGKKIKEETKKKKKSRTVTPCHPTARQVSAVSEKDTHSAHARTTQ